MEFLNLGNTVLSLTIGFGAVFAGGVGVFFIIRSQLTKTLQEEVDAYKDKVDRLSKDLEEMKEIVKTLQNENDGLLKERTYLRGLIMEALTTKSSVNKSILEEVIKNNG